MSKKPAANRKTERNLALLSDRCAGMTYPQLAEKYEISKDNCRALAIREAKLLAQNHGMRHCESIELLQALKTHYGMNGWALSASSVISKGRSYWGIVFSKEPGLMAELERYCRATVTGELDEAEWLDEQECAQRKRERVRHHVKMWHWRMDWRARERRREERRITDANESRSAAEKQRIHAIVCYPKMPDFMIEPRIHVEPISAEEFERSASIGPDGFIYLSDEPS